MGDKSYKSGIRPSPLPPPTRLPARRPPGRERRSDRRPAEGIPRCARLGRRLLGGPGVHCLRDSRGAGRSGRLVASGRGERRSVRERRTNWVFALRASQSSARRVYQPAALQ